MCISNHATHLYKQNDFKDKWWPSAENLWKTAVLKTQMHYSCSTIEEAPYMQSLREKFCFKTPSVEECHFVAWKTKIKAMEKVLLKGNLKFEFENWISHLKIMSNHEKLKSHYCTLCNKSFCSRRYFNTHECKFEKIHVWFV